MGGTAISDPTVIRACAKSGLLQKYKNEAALLVALEKTLEDTMQEASRASHDEQFFRALNATLVLLKTLCDVIFLVLGDKVPVVNAAYEVGQILAEAVTDRLTTKKLVIAQGNAAVDRAKKALERSGRSTRVIGSIQFLANLADQLSDLTEIDRGIYTIDDARKTAGNQLAKIRAQLREVNYRLAECGVRDSSTNLN
ncbi:hypothetical protein [Pseudomonas putida]